MPRNLNWPDSLSSALAYAVLTKQNRLQVLVHPTRQQLRRRGKRGWSLVAAVPGDEGNNHGTDLPDEVRETILQTLQGLAAPDHAAEKGKKKSRDRNRAYSSE